MVRRTKILSLMLGGLLLSVCGATAMFYVTLKQSIDQIPSAPIVNLTLRAGALNLLILLPIFVFAVLLIELMLRPLRTSLNQAAATVERLAAGDINVTVAPSAQGEMERFTNALAQLTGYLHDVAAVAQNLARQDFHVTVTPRSDHDTLNQAMQQMILTLQTMFAEAERSLMEIEQQNWLKDGVNRLNTELSGDASPPEICQRAVSFLARQLGAGRGIVYVYHAEQSLLSVGGTFALTDQDQQLPTVRLGQGIVGQAARERQPIVLTKIMRSDATIATGTVSAPPLSTYTAPLTYNDNLYGVLELASFEEFTPLQQNFLQEANRVIAAVLSSALQREHVQMLLRQSQQAVKEAEQAAYDARESAEALQQANTQLEEQQQQLLQQSEEFRQINRHLEEQQQTVQQQQTELRQRDEALQQVQAEFQRRIQALENEYQQKSERQPPAGNSEPKDAGDPILQPTAFTPGRPEYPMPPGSVPRVLLVEDHQSQREALEEFLSQSVQAEIIGVASQEEARIEIDTGRYTAMILDLGLPDGSGYDLCTYINIHNLPLPVIIYTARDLSENEVHNLERYAASIIVKTARSAERLVDELTLLLSQPPAPKTTPAAPPVSSVPSAAPVDLHGRTIVLADADVKYVFITASLLEDLGATVLEARTGREALAHLHAAPDIAGVLWDVALPDSDATLREIRQDARFKRLPILALTAQDSEEQRQQSIQAGANDYLPKPVEPAALLRALNVWLKQV